MDAQILQKANGNWIRKRQSRYAVSSLFVGAILLDGTKAVLLLCIEPYRRERGDRSDHEGYSIKEQNITLPGNDLLGNVCVKAVHVDNNSTKLVHSWLTAFFLTTIVEETKKAPAKHDLRMFVRGSYPLPIEKVFFHGT